MRPEGYEGYDDLMADGDQQPRQPFFSIGTPFPTMQNRGADFAAGFRTMHICPEPGQDPPLKNGDPRAVAVIAPETTVGKMRGAYGAEIDWAPDAPARNPPWRSPRGKS